MYKILALVGKAGAGKDSIMQAVLRVRPDLHEIVSCTSRPMREGETEGVNYHYYSEQDFKNLIQSREMLEWTVFNNWYYGTGYTSLDENKINIGVFNPQGIKSMKQHDNVILTVVEIQALDKTRMLRQLNRETYPDVKEIIRRFSADEKDFSDMSFNPNAIGFNETKEDFESIVQGIRQNLDGWFPEDINH